MTRWCLTRLVLGKARFGARRTRMLQRGAVDMAGREASLLARSEANN